jgi:hypothetical protein
MVSLVEPIHSLCPVSGEGGMTAATGLPKRVDPNGLLGLLYTTFEGISANR